MIISKAFYRHLPLFLNLFKCPLRGLICLSDAYTSRKICIDFMHNISKNMDKYA
jgi:hypothetical protein